MSNQPSAAKKLMADEESSRPSKPYIVLPERGNQPLVFDDAIAKASGVEAYKSLRTRLMNAQRARGFRSICVTSAAQGDGKTLTSINLAYCCAQLEEMSTLLVDADLRTRTLTSFMENESSPGLADVLSGELDFDRAVSSTSASNLSFMGAGRSGVSPAELFSGERWKTFMQWASENFKLVLVDSQPSGAVADFELIAGHCDAVLLVVRAARTVKEDLQESISLIDPAKLVGVVWNCAEDLRASYYYKPRT